MSLTALLSVIVLALVGAVVGVSRLWGKNSAEKKYAESVVKESADANKIKTKVKTDEKYRNHIRDYFNRK